MEFLSSLSLSELQPFLNNPEQLTRESVSFQLAVANFPQTPRHLLQILIESPDPRVSEAAQMHVNWAGEIADNCTDAVEEKLKACQLGQNDRLAVELLKIAPVSPDFLSQWVPVKYLMDGLSNPYLPLRYRLKLLERLAQEPTLEPRLQVAESSETPLAVLEQLAGSLEIPVRLAIKFNPSCPPQLIQLVEGQHEIASNWDTETEQLAMLARSRWDWIRLAVAQNPFTSPETLMLLARDKVFKIRLAVAKNSFTPASILSVLAESENEIQKAIALHPHATEEILHRLYSTQQVVIRSRQDLPASILERFFNDSYKDIYLFLRQPNTPTWILAEIANVDLEALKADILANSHRSPIIQSSEEWLRDKTNFLMEVATHPQVSVEILESLSQYPNPRVQLAVTRNIKTPQSLRNYLLKQVVIEAEDYIKVNIASAPQTPVEILEQLSGVSSSLNTMTEMLSQIAPDATPHLLNRIKVFIDRHQSPELVLFWMQQGPEFQASILNDWDDLIASLNEEEQQTLEYISHQKSSVEWKGKFTVERASDSTSTSSRSDRLEPKYQLLDRLMYFLNMSYNCDITNQKIIAGLLSNSSTPVNLREQLWQKHKKEADDFNRYNQDASLRFALGCNLAVPENERLEYLEQALTSGWRDISEAIAKHPNTPVEILEIIAQSGGGLQQIVKNPNAPVHILRQAVEQIENSSGLSHTLIDITKNLNTPVDLLEYLALDKGKYGVCEAVLENPRLDHLTRTKIQLEIQEKEEIQKANQILAERTNTPYALAQVVEKGDQNAKISVARNLQTPIHILEQLAKDDDETVRSVVSKNPNLPLNSLLELAEDASFQIRLSLACNRLHQSTPIPILKKLAQDESDLVRAEVAANKDTPVEILTKLAQDSSHEVCHQLTHNPNTPVEVLELLGVEKGIVNAYNLKTPGTALAAAVEQTLEKDSRTQKKIFEFLLRDLEGSQMPASTLEKLATHQASWIRSDVAHHRNTSLSVLETMIDDEYEPVLRGIARNPNSSPQLLESLLNRHETVARAMVERSEIPINLMEKLLDHKSEYIRQRIVSRPNLPLELAGKIINTELEKSVLISLARNPSLTTELLTQFIQHSNANVRQILVNHPNLTESHWQQLAQDRALPVREAVALNAKVSTHILEILSRDREAQVRGKVATNPRTPVSVLESLVQDEDATVRIAVASNPNLPLSYLEQLALDDTVEVRRAVANYALLRNLAPKPTSRQTNPTLISLSRIYNPKTDDLASVLVEYAQSENDFVRLVTLLHPLTPVEILQQAAQSISWVDRYAVAENPATPNTVKEQLIQDSNRFVRATAKANL
ncbi:hypothetical protein C7H19_06495 [Aphanothece hegewaldii CCALA 016]|uniref:Leucine rich repeat variant n=1 Tax=Aphanothece hegewaldii CCALA 016 TaxID=2107694 RepID=A0A2T1M0I4_9CHRO|nr:HEAT repeat domain-containing protein [Aphanothece hegewaldii]PSF38115.1 hypothetical protein C7H19_06495 [Aphanothece hegewaldii CCALA 016]